MKIIIKKISEIIPYVNNIKEHPQEHIDQIKSSIIEFGFNDPIAVDENNVIIEGHGRYEALKQLGYDEVEVISLKHLSEAQKKAYIIAHNKLTMNTGFNEDLLKIELERIKELDFNLELTGFNIDEISALLNTESEEEVFEDDFEPPYIEIKNYSKKGDIWLLGNHKLMCGDSTNSLDVDKLMDGVIADLIITDPPYNVNYQGKTGEKLKIQNDNMTNDNFYHFLLDAFNNFSKIMKIGCPIYIFHGDNETINFRRAMSDAGLKLSQCLIWVKNGFVMGRQDYHWKHEPCLYGWKEGEAHKWYGARNKDTILEIEEDQLDISKLKKQELVELIEKLLEDKKTEHTTIIEADKTIKNDLHPTMKPLKLIGYLLKNSSQKNDVIVDLFGGSGSTMIASEQLQRTCYLMELDEMYVDRIVKRFVDFKGPEADVKLIRDGITYDLKDIKSKMEIFYAE